MTNSSGLPGYGASSWDNSGSPILAVLPPQVEQELVWHYTSGKATRSIIDSEAFWATSITTLNDTSEMFFGMDLVRRYWESIGENSDHRERIDRWVELADLTLHGERRSDSYVLSASTIPDSLAQWDRYGHCVIGIATEPIMTKRSLPEAAGGRIGPTFTTGWRPVIYDESAQRAHVARLFDVLESLCAVELWERNSPWKAADADGVECILRSIVYLKAPEWAFEAEVRLYGQARSTGARVENHESAFGPSTHIMVFARDALDGIDSLPIVTIRIATIAPAVLDQAAAIEQLARRKLPAATVELVKTTFRKSLDPSQAEVRDWT